MHLVTATLLSFQLIIASDPSSFGASASSQLTTQLQQHLQCHQPACRVDLSLLAGSVTLQVALTLLPQPFDDFKNNFTSRTGVPWRVGFFVSQLANNVTNGTAELGVTVLSASPVAVSEVAVAAVARAPPPMPSPPPAPLEVDLVLVFSLTGPFAAGAFLFMTYMYLAQNHPRKLAQAEQLYQKLLRWLLCQGGKTPVGPTA